MLVILVRVIRACCRFRCPRTVVVSVLIILIINITKLLKIHGGTLASPMHIELGQPLHRRDGCVNNN